MSRARVRPDIGERVLGHTIQGVEGVYDRHTYRDEKAHALRALASLIENITNPPAKVVNIKFGNVRYVGHTIPIRPCNARANRLNRLLRDRLSAFSYPLS